MKARVLGPPVVDALRDFAVAEISDYGQQQLGQAAKAGYFIMNGRTPESWKEAWVGWCQSQRQPCVFLHVGRRYVHIEMNLAQPGLDDAALAVYRPQIVALARYSQRPWRCCAGVWSYLERIPVSSGGHDQSHLLAQEMVVIGRKILNNTPPSGVSIADIQIPFGQLKSGAQWEKVYKLMCNGEWLTVPEIARRIGATSENGISARLRDLRKPQFGGHTVRRRKREGVRSKGEYEFQLMPRQKTKSEAESFPVPEPVEAR